MLPASCSICTSMRDTSALRWTERLSHAEAAQKRMHTEKSNHYSKDTTHNLFLYSGKKMSRFIQRLTNYSGSCKIKNIGGEKSLKFFKSHREQQYAS